MSESDHVTIGVPVYRGVPFVEETLRSIRAQTHRHFDVVISVDGADGEVERVCAPFLRDSRFRLVVQPERLGWVGNINWLMSQATDGFWYYHQQDDLVEPSYVEVLLDHARRTPDAAVVYTDLVAFGTRSFRIAQPSVAGSPSARQLMLLYGHHPAVAFRGLTRVEALRKSGRIRPNEIDNFCSDTTWMAAIARSGDLLRVPIDLYRKRYHDNNEHAKWADWPLERRVAAWTVHCAHMLGEAMLVEATSQERRLLWLVAAGRLISPKTAAAYLPVATMTAAEKTAVFDGFVDYLRVQTVTDVPAWLDAPWHVIDGWTRGVYS